jgi:phytoene synthase
MHIEIPSLDIGIIRKHRQSSFAPAFWFLSRDRRRALEVLYAVCRLLDDVVDQNVSGAAAILAAWRKAFTDSDATAVADIGHQKMAEEFLAAVEKFGIPLSAMIDLIDKGVGVDLQQSRFRTAMDTEAYCYGVAGTVGLACLPIFGVPVAEGKAYAARLGIAVQWTNLIRDVGADAEMGRIYLPLDHLEQFGYTEADLFARKNSPEFKALMQREYEVAVSHYRRAEDLLPPAWRKTLLPARIMASIYRRLLEKLKQNDFPVLQARTRLNLMEKFGAVWTAFRRH